MKLTRIGRYEVLSELGQGGFGRVYKARDPRIDRLVAIKVMNTEDDPDLLVRFRNEAVVAGSLNHPHIVTLYELGEHDGQPYIAMEFVAGRDLSKVRSDELSLYEKLQVLSQVADGLSCAHRSAIIHRDIKPANIMLVEGGE